MYNFNIKTILKLFCIILIKVEKNVKITFLILISIIKDHF